MSFLCGALSSRGYLCMLWNSLLSFFRFVGKMLNMELLVQRSQTLPLRGYVEKIKHWLKMSQVDSLINLDSFYHKCKRISQQLYSRPGMVVIWTCDWPPEYVALLFIKRGRYQETKWLTFFFFYFVLYLCYPGFCYLGFNNLKASIHEVFISCRKCRKNKWKKSFFFLMDVQFLRLDFLKL